MKRTKMFFQGLAVSACLFSTNVFAATIEATAPDFSSTGYVLRESLVLNPVEGEARPFALDAGSEIAILGVKQDAALGTLVHLGIDAPAEGQIPSDVWVSDRDLPQESLERYAPADESDANFTTLMTYCYRYVKQYLLQTGQVKVYLPGASAWMAANELPKHGFRRTGHSPAAARNGEVCVYSGGPQGHGHIEVKRNGKWWYGYGFKANPIAGRRFIGCYAK